MERYVPDADDALHLTRLTLDRFGAVALAWRKQAQHGDRTTRLVADALESVLRRRIARATAIHRFAAATAKPKPARQEWLARPSWWPL